MIPFVKVLNFDKGFLELLSIGAEVKVLEPKSLQDEMKKSY